MNRLGRTVVVKVGSRTARLKPGATDWEIEYRSPKTGRDHYPSGYGLGFKVPADRVREILIKLDEAEKDFDHSPELEVSR